MNDTSLDRGKLVLLSQKDTADIKQISTFLFRRRVLILGISCVVISVAGLLALKAKPTYQSSMQLLVESDITEDKTATDISINTNKNTILSTLKGVEYNPQLGLILSSKLIKKAVDSLRSEYPDLTVEDIKGKHKNPQKRPLAITVIDAGGGSNQVFGQVFELSFESNDPVKAQKVLQALQKVYKDYDLKQRKQRLDQALNFVNDRLTKIKQEVKQAEGNLEKFRKKYNLIDPEVQGKILLENLSEIKKQLQTTRAQLQDVQARHKNLQKEIAYSPQNIPLPSPSPVSQSNHYQTLLDEIQKTELSLSQERQRFTDDSPVVQNLIQQHQSQLELLQTEIERSHSTKDLAKQVTDTKSEDSSKWEALKQALGEKPSPQANPEQPQLIQGLLGEIDQKLMQQLIDVQTTAEGLSANEQSLAQSEKQIRSELNKYPTLISEYNRLLPQVQATRKKLEQMTAAQQALGLRIAQTGSDLQVLEEPLRGTDLGSNSLLFILGGIILAPLLGVGTAIIRELSDNVVYSPQELQKLTHLRLLATVPKLSKPRRYKQLLNLPKIWHSHKDQDKDTSKTKTLPVYATWPSHESLDIAYQNLQIVTSSVSSKSVMLTSAQPKEGKTSIALGLAVSAARMHKRVLLIDANLREPSLHKTLELSNDWGLSLLLLDETDTSDQRYIQPVHPSIDVLTAGSPAEDPIKLLSSERMKQLLESFEQTYDLVFIDAPAIVKTVDARILATLCDRIIMVSRVGKVSQADLIQATDILKNLNLVGVIANTAQ
ncbi:MAG: polysaccharide biosynthesis tyrosine autokinase [Pelatocladus maniniholoensis HA4357-MV3]|jgi:succinoglycan biosynthesis transport protein ExoP|uniref:Polysaccharide biosynthesis tyrosine autokinase n=1 Tax=Pelatocladus maniniholoensis HA4357-MV3 TaxID=1117104 RepID=A0A9E3LRE9_9NOST|nr:polysaccharide biosynthesis tyrosine autokinase [Pelatocladus maniniholoensis HA4357-MV3]BAZ70103.1 lipopolysaccharide biosynthesis protein [Fischerella sp. NIES-4106]